MSDGLPEGARSNLDDLKGFIRELRNEPNLELIALGIGPNTDHVLHIYPNAKANIPLDQLSDVIGQLIHTALLRHVGHNSST